MIRHFSDIADILIPANDLSDIDASAQYFDDDFEVDESNISNIVQTEIKNSSPSVVANNGGGPVRYDDEDIYDNEQFFDISGVESLSDAGIEVKESNKVVSNLESGSQLIGPVYLQNSAGVRLREFQTESDVVSERLQENDMKTIIAVDVPAQARETFQSNQDSHKFHPKSDQTSGNSISEHILVIGTDSNSNAPESQSSPIRYEVPNTPSVHPGALPYSKPAPVVSTQKPHLHFIASTSRHKFSFPVLSRVQVAKDIDIPGRVRGRGGPPGGHMGNARPPSPSLGNSARNPEIDIKEYLSDLIRKASSDEKAKEEILRMTAKRAVLVPNMGRLATAGVREGYEGLGNKFEGKGQGHSGGSAGGDMEGSSDSSSYSDLGIPPYDPDYRYALELRRLQKQEEVERSSNSSSSSPGDHGKKSPTEPFVSRQLGYPRRGESTAGPHRPPPGQDDRARRTSVSVSVSKDKRALDSGVLGRGREEQGGGRVRVGTADMSFLKQRSAEVHAAFLAGVIGVSFPLIHRT